MNVVNTETLLMAAGLNVWLFLFVHKAFIKKNEVDSKMMGALLTGVNRAYPYAKGKTQCSALLQ